MGVVAGGGNGRVMRGTSRQGSRRQALLDAGMTAFARRGYAATSVADLVEAVGVSKAAFTYHFRFKSDLLHELVDPLLDALDAVVDSHPRHPQWPEGVRALLTDYIDVLLAHRDVAAWVDADKSVHAHAVAGARLRASNAHMREAITGPDSSAAQQVAASAVLGTLWRPIRNLPPEGIDPAAHRQVLLDAALASYRPMVEGR